MALSNRPIRRLNDKYFSTFLAVDKYRNFTLAGDEVGLSQGGVTKQIQELEEQVGAQLFKRCNNSVLVTHSGQRLRLYIKHYQDSLSTFSADLKEDSLVQGDVSYAMPPSCLLSPHFPMLLEKRKSHPDLNINVHLGPNYIVREKLLRGEIDFGFVTERTDNKDIDYLLFCQEEYILVSSEPISSDSLLDEGKWAAKFIGYPGVRESFNFWIRHYMPNLVHTDFRSLHIQNSIATIEGAIMMVKGNVGVSVFPRHCVQDDIDKELLFEISSDVREPLLNDIYIITIANYSVSKRVDQVIRWFEEMKSAS